MVTSAEMIYAKTMHSARKINSNGTGVNEKSLAIFEKGIRSATIQTINVAVKSEKLGLDLKKGLLVRMTRTTNDADITDSINHPVRN